jgi:hypothetical protein
MAKVVLEHGGEMGVRGRVETEAGAGAETRSTWIQKNVGAMQGAMQCFSTGLKKETAGRAGRARRGRRSKRIFTTRTGGVIGSNALRSWPATSSLPSVAGAGHPCSAK